jgi:predicted N-acetyltransferase YhbS
MDNIQIVERAASPQEFIGLRKAVGWGCPGEEAVKNGLCGNLFSVCAEHEGRIVGHGRIIGDGAFTLYIQDIIVLPEYQRRGIGMMIMTGIMEHIKGNYGKGTMVNLMSARGKEDFYRKFGFFVRPDDNFGSGMTQFL